MVRGSSTMYPDNVLATQGGVVVIMNYRMCLLGFFSYLALAAESPNDVREHVRRKLDPPGDTTANAVLVTRSAGEP